MQTSELLRVIRGLHNWKGRGWLIKDSGVSRAFEVLRV